MQQGKEETYGARLTYTPTAWWSHAVTIGIDRFDNGYHNTQPRLTTSSDTLVSVDQFTQSKASVAYHTSLLFHPWRDISANVIAGVDHYTFDYSGFFNFAAPTATNSISGATGYQSVITNTGYFTQARLSMWDVLFLTGGLRAEQNSTVGSELGPPVSPRAGLSLVRPIGAGTVKFRGSYGEATRPPAPFLRDGSVSPFAVTLANPFLAPERQKGWDAGVDLVFGAKGSLSATYYHQTAEDLIQFVLVDATSKPVTYQNQNVGRAKNTGVELEGTLFSEVAQLRAQYAYTRSRVDALGPNYTGNLQVGDQVLLVPKQTAGAALTVAPLRGTNLTAGVTYVGKWTNYDFLGLYACFGGTGPCQQSLRGYQIQYPGFAKVNVQISQRITSIVSAFLSVDNLTNNDAYEYANSMTALGRTTMLGVRAQY